MGLDYTTYIGPFIKVFSPKLDDTEERLVCPNEKGCPNYKKQVCGAGFCSKCGTETRFLSFPVKKQKDFDWHNEFNDKLIKVFREYSVEGFEEYLFFVSNIKGFGENFDPKYEQYLEFISPDRINDELCAFTNAFKNEIRRLKEVFGEQNVEVKWGVIGDIS